MKNRSLIALILTLALLGGCSYRVTGKTSNPEPSTAPGTSSATPPAIDTQTEPGLSEEELLHRVLVSFRYEQKQYTHETDNALLLDYSCVTPEVTLPGLEQQEKAIRAVLEKRAELFQKGSGKEGDILNNGVEAALAAARADYERQEEKDGLSYSLSRYVRVMRGDASVLSFVYNDYSYSAGAHGNAAVTGLTFDVESGQELRFSDLSEDSAALADLCMQEIRAQAAERAEFLYENYEEYLPTLLNDGNWYFTERALVFVASPYAIAPYAAGVIEFPVSYKKLSGILHERYQRPAKAIVQGGMNIGWPAEMDFGSQEPLQELRLDDLSPFLLWAEHTVYNVRLTSVSYLDYSGSFQEKRELLYASRMDDGEFWRVSADIPDVIPNLLLSWQLPDGTIQRCLITMSGMDGSLRLVDPNSLGMIQPGELRADQIWYGYLWDLNGDEMPESLLLSEEGGICRLAVSRDGVESAVSTGFVPAPSCFVADVDGDGFFEILLCGEDAAGKSKIAVWRYDQDLSSVAFTVDGEKKDTLAGTILGADGDGLIVSGQVDILGSYTGSRPFGGGPGGTLAPLAGSAWDLSGNERYITASTDPAFAGEDGSSGRLCAGTRLRVTGYDGAVVRFETDGGIRGSLAVSRKDDGSLLVDGKTVAAAFDGIAQKQ